MSSTQIVRDLAALANPERALHSAGYFKTGKGQYGEGDIFLGVAVPALRKVALRYKTLPLTGVSRLLQSRIHEHRLAALEILVAQYERAAQAQQQIIFDFYLKNTKRMNNWDLVDTAAPYIVGVHLKSRPRTILHTLAKSENVWERRIAIVSTLGLIKTGEVRETFRIAVMLLGDKYDLIHKAVGWALREAGKKSPERLLRFLEKHYSVIPRTALRYAIERFDPASRKRLLAGQFDLKPG
jgi:3-methyladenine DNA glycosylase AlkD